MVLPTGDERLTFEILWAHECKLFRALRSCRFSLLKLSEFGPFARATSRVDFNRPSARNRSPLCRVCRLVAAHECNCRRAGFRLAAESSTDARWPIGVGVALPTLRSATGASAPLIDFAARCGAVRQCDCARPWLFATCSEVGATSGSVGSSQAGLPRSGWRSLPRRKARATTSVMGRSDDFS